MNLNHRSRLCGTTEMRIAGPGFCSDPRNCELGAKRENLSCAFAKRPNTPTHLCNPSCLGITVSQTFLVVVEIEHIIMPLIVEARAPAFLGESQFSGCKCRRQDLLSVMSAQPQIGDRLKSHSTPVDRTIQICAHEMCYAATTLNADCMCDSQFIAVRKKHNVGYRRRSSVTREASVFSTESRTPAVAIAQQDLLWRRKNSIPQPVVQKIGVITELEHPEGISFFTYASQFLQ